MNKLFATTLLSTAVAFSVQARGCNRNYPCEPGNSENQPLKSTDSLLSISVAASMVDCG